jgi:2-haloacid dehalogenase
MARDRAVLWDLGHTLVDWEPRRVYRTLLDTDDAVEAFLGGVCSMDWHAAHDRGVSMADNRRALIEQHPDKAELITAWDTRWADMFDGWIDGMDAVVAALEALGAPQYGLTNLPAEKWPHILKTYPEIGRFEDVIVSGVEGVIKPDPRIYEITARRLPFAPEDVLFLDDRPDNIEAAIKAGFKGHVFDGAPGAIAALRAHGLSI